MTASPQVERAQSLVKNQFHINYFSQLFESGLDEQYQSKPPSIHEQQTRILYNSIFNSPSLVNRFACLDYITNGSSNRTQSNEISHHGNKTEPKLNIRGTEGAICSNNNSKNQNQEKGEVFLRVDKVESRKNLTTDKLRHNVQSVAFLIILIALINANGTPVCHCSDYFEPVGDSGLFESGHPNINSQQNGHTALTNLRDSPPSRSINVPMMPTMMDSFSRDQFSESQNSPQGWTSIFNPFGLGTSQNRPTQSQRPVDNSDSLDTHIRKILVPRVSGTPGNVQVRKYITDSLEKNNYHIESDEFSTSTPFGDVKFANIIASSNPNACRQLILACHYDSKLMDGFLGATDSAVPCAMLLKISESFSESFRQSSNNPDNSPQDDLGLRFIFFDGEEAFVQWTSKDSLYGSRHLAAKWAKQKAPTTCGSDKSELDRIELFVLLDLIGASDTSFVMYGSKQRSHYEALQKYEKDYLSKNNLSQSRRDIAFKSRTVSLDFVEDDHVPFKQRGVPILLLLAHPFPRVWHTTNDNYEAIDFPRTRRILHSMEKFVENYQAVRT